MGAHTAAVLARVRPTSFTKVLGAYLAARGQGVPVFRDQFGAGQPASKSSKVHGASWAG